MGIGRGRESGRRWRRCLFEWMFAFVMFELFQIFHLLAMLILIEYSFFVASLYFPWKGLLS